MLDEKIPWETYNTRDLAILREMEVTPMYYDNEIIGFHRMSDELSRIDTWSPLAYRDARFLVMRFHHRDDGSSGTAGATTFIPPRPAIAQSQHRRSMPADSI